MEPNPIWSQVENILRNRKQEEMLTDFQEIMLIFRFDVWSEAIASGSSEIGNSMKFKIPAFDTIARKM